MTHEEFNRAFEEIRKADDFISKLNDLRINIFESPMGDALYYFQRKYFEQEYGKEGYDWISWYLYEKMNHENPDEFKAWDENGNEIIRNEEELYTYLEENYQKNLDNTKK